MKTLARRESGLPLVSAYDGDETLDVRSLGRTFETFVEPLGGQEAEPFHVAASLSWRWDAVATAHRDRRWPAGAAQRALRLRL